MSTSSKALGFVFICAYIFPGIAMAESDFQVGGAVGIQSKQLTYQVGGIAFKPTIQTAVYSLTTSYGKFFVNAELETTIESSSQYIGSPNPATGGTTTTIESRRSDSVVTLGYNLWRGLSVFGGYKQGETESNMSPAEGGVVQIILSEKGPFAGIAYAQPIGTKGSLAVSAAYANLDGELELRFFGRARESTTGGTTSGLSYGISWNGALSERAYYRLSFKVNQYKFKDKDLAFDSTDTSTDEDYKIIGLSVGTSF